MSFQFSTCVPKDAGIRIDTALDTYVGGENYKELRETVLKRVSEGKLRVGDPIMYGGQAPLFFETSCPDVEMEEIKSLFYGLKKPGGKL